MRSLIECRSAIISRRSKRSKRALTTKFVERDAPDAGRNVHLERGGGKIGIELDLQPEEIDQIRRSAQTPISLEKPVGDEDESEFGHFLTDETAPLPDEMAEETLRNEALRTILKSLSHRERRVLELRYGLDGEQPRTLDEVGRAFNVTRERIRQIENQGLKKLRALALAAQLRDVA